MFAGVVPGGALLATVGEAGTATSEDAMGRCDAFGLQLMLTSMDTVLDAMGIDCTPTVVG